MQPRFFIAGLLLLVLTGTAYFFLHKTPQSVSQRRTFSANGLLSAPAAEEDDEEDFTPQRLQHEFEMLRNPVTGTIPANIQQIEMAVANRIPQRTDANALLLYRTSDISGVQNQNIYSSVGPNNAGGRSRTLAFDRRNANVVLTGGVTGGIFRSTDGGASWSFVSGENDIRSANALAQDPVNPDTWYCGTGEVYYPASAGDIAGTFGYGVFKSTNNGLTWTKLAATEDGQQHAFNGQFDLVHRMAVHPATRDVYAAVHNRIMRSTDGGTTWTTVLGGTVANSALNAITEVIIPSTGSKIFAAFSGGNADRALAGVWESSTGNVNDWKRIAGGPSGATDSIAGWQPYGQWSRVVLALNSANTKLFVLYKNGKSASGTTPQPEADLFSANISSGNSSSYVWTDLNAYVPDEPNFNYAGVDPYTTQFNGYNMSITLKPDNDNILFIGGTVLERVDLTKTDPAQKFRRVGGYGKGFFPDNANKFIYPNHHPDVHGIYFATGAPDVMYTVDDGGVQKTTSSTLADTVTWQPLNTNLQTFQFQFVNIHPDLDANFIIGGAQDNGTYINLNPPALDQVQIQGGDGASTAISQFSKSGNTWKQWWYNSISQGYIERDNLTWQNSNNNLSLSAFTRDDITPTGLSNNGQWLTLFVNDPDSTEHLYYNNNNRLFRTRTASTVTASTWTELTGVSNTLTGQVMSAMAISKGYNGVKYLYTGTKSGKVYRLNNANLTAATSTPVDITPSGMTADSYVSGVSINPRNPDTVLVTVSNYDATGSTVNNIFWTGNATSATPTWQVIDGALAPLSSQSCAIVLKTTGVEYYVGTSVGLYSATSIAGTNTQWFNEGSGMLKKAIVRSLVNRQKDNALVVGTHGNGAFYAAIGNAVNLDNNIVTGINNPVVNDQNFIRTVYPTLTNGRVYFTIGNRFSVRQISVEVYGINGQKVYAAQQGYQNGSVNLGTLARGAYVLQITSSDGKYKQVQKILKE